MRNLLSRRNIKQFFGYGAVGILNTLLSFGIINLLIWYTGISKGLWFLVFSFVAFFISVIHSFVWNKYLIFAKEENNELRHREYLMFFLVTGLTSLLNIGILHVLVNVIGAPYGIGAHLWANIALCITIPFAVVCNFLGYKFLVFAE